MWTPNIPAIVLTLLIWALSSAATSDYHGVSIDPIAAFNIRNTLSLYAVSIDTKDFVSLSQVFTRDALADYGPNLGVLSGLDLIETTLADSLRPVSTQHALSTQIIKFGSETKVNTTTYFTASHFGIGDYEGEVLYAYGRYDDFLVETGKGWRIKRRTLSYMGPFIGNGSIFTTQKT